MNSLTRSKLATGNSLNRSLVPILLIAVSGTLASCAGASDTESEQTANASQALQYDASLLGCPYSGYVAIKSINGYYCVADSNSWMTCYSKTLTHPGYFKVVNNGNGTVSLQARDGANESWLRFVQPRNGGGSGIYHDGTAAGGYTALTPLLLDSTNNVYWFETVRDYYITAENGGGGVMNANRSSPSTWERLKVECY
jgi:hypothetical protein